MTFSFFFFLNAAAFGAGLAMDAFSVSLANGLNEPGMSRGKAALIAGTFGGFQIFMPLAGWFCVHTVAEAFTSFQKFIPWIALILLGWIGGKMLYDGVRGKDEETVKTVGYRALLLQGVATSIDALSVGFTIANLTFPYAAAEAAIIGAVTFVLCLIGLKIGQRFGVRLARKASVLGGVILIGIGIEIFVSHFFFK